MRGCDKIYRIKKKITFKTNLWMDIEEIFTYEEEIHQGIRLKKKERKHNSDFFKKKWPISDLSFCQNEDFFLNFAKKRIFCVFCAKKRISGWILVFSCDIARKLFNIWCFIALCHCLLLYSKFWGASSLFSFYYFYLFIYYFIVFFYFMFLLLLLLLLLLWWKAQKIRLAKEMFKAL